MSLGLMGRKLGMMQINDEKRGRVAATLLEVGPCLVVQKKTVEKDGYDALKLGFGPRKESRTNKPTKGIFDRIKSAPKRHLREYRVSSEELGKYEIGQEIKATDLFAVGQSIDVAGNSKGSGFTGVMKRWGFGGKSRTHGTHEFFRHGGSIGGSTWPGRVMKNQKMPGQHGNRNVTTLNLPILKVLEEENCLVIAGAVPGATQGLVEIRPTVRG